MDAVEEMQVKKIAPKYEFDFRERYFNPTELSRKERRQIKYEENLARKRPEATTEKSSEGQS